MRFVTTWIDVFKLVVGHNPQAVCPPVSVTVGQTGRDQLFARLINIAKLRVRHSFVSHMPSAYFPIKLSLYKISLPLIPSRQNPSHFRDIINLIPFTKFA